MVNPLDKIYSAVEQLRSSGAYKNYKTISSPQGAWLVVDDKEVLNLCSNNYLGLASHPRVIAASVNAVNKYGVGTGAVRALSGNSLLHEQLEKDLAKFKKVESVMVVQSGFVANLIAVQTILDKEDIVISDELNHASIIDAVRLAQVQTKFVYAHNNMEDLAVKLAEATSIRQNTKRAGGTEKSILIITDGVFSMDGDIAPLPEIVKLAKEFGAITMVDDAHGEGVLGASGGGIVDHFNLHGQVDIEVGTLSKALGVIGGCIAGSTKLIEFYKQKARPFAFSTGLSIPDTAALIAAVNILSSSNELVKKLWQNADYLKKAFQRLGFDIGVSQTPITPVMIGDEDLARKFSQLLFEEGIFATPILFPMVAKGKARIRVMPSATHTKEDLDLGIKAFEFVARELGILN